MSPMPRRQGLLRQTLKLPLSPINVGRGEVKTPAFEAEMKTGRKRRGRVTLQSETHVAVEFYDTGEVETVPIEQVRTYPLR